MTSPVESLTAGADVADAAQIMVDERIRCLPIVDGYGVVGILTRRDVLRAAIADNDQDLAAEISRQLAAMDNPDRWQVAVQAGVVDIEDSGTDTIDRALASRLAGGGTGCRPGPNPPSNAGSLLSQSPFQPTSRSKEDPMEHTAEWKIKLFLFEHDNGSTAQVVLDTGVTTLHGEGHAGQYPDGRMAPEIDTEIAAGRALDRPG